MEASTNHEKFQERLRASEKARWLFANWLACLGYTVNLAPLSEAPSADRWKEFADTGDLFVAMRVEVKHRNYEFMRREDWPYPDFIVCGRNAFDRANPKPYVIAHLNKARTHAAFVRGSDSHLWKSGRNPDRHYGDDHEEEVYFAPLESIVFAELVRPPESAAVWNGQTLFEYLKEL
jgi:hypothetical protein